MKHNIYISIQEWSSRFSIRHQDLRYNTSQANNWFAYNSVQSIKIHDIGRATCRAWPVPSHVPARTMHVMAECLGICKFKGQYDTLNANQGKSQVVTHIHNSLRSIQHMNQFLHAINQEYRLWKHTSQVCKMPNSPADRGAIPYRPFKTGSR